MTDSFDLRFVFLDIGLFENGAAIRGGALITDVQTKPYEFRCTSPVRPTSLQQVLYGRTLQEYVYIELIGVPLIRATKEKITLILVRNPLLLRIRPFVSYPVVLIQRDPKSTISANEVGINDLKPVVLSSHHDYAAEAHAAKAQLASLTQRQDLFEPFESCLLPISPQGRMNRLNSQFIIHHIE